MNTDFIKGVVVPILTPIDGEERIDEARLRDQVDYVIKGGVSGILAFGSNGEFYMVVGELLADIGVSLGAGGSPDGVHRVPLIFGRDLTAVGADNTGKAPRHCTLTSKSPDCSSAAARMGS